ncbi:hypothetical protein ACWGA9_27130, partial [Streptomyces sp. NPDC054950]
MVETDTALQLLWETHGEPGTGPRPFAAFPDASGMAAPAAAVTAAEAPVPSAGQRCRPWPIAARLVRGRGQG